MRLALLLVGGASVVGLLAGAVLRRLGSAWGDRVQLAAGILARLAVGVAFAWQAVAAFERGGPWIDALGVLLGLLALASFVFAAVVVWVLVRRPALLDE